MEKLKVIADAMDYLNLNYDFGEWNDESKYPYFVGEYHEEDSYTEDGMQETSFILNGFHRGSWIELEKAKEKIAAYFNKVTGKIAMTGSGSAIAIFYGNALIIPQEDASLKRIQINLTIKEWKGTV